MSAPATLLQNLLSATPGAVSAVQLKRLQSAATLDGNVDKGERSFFTKLRKNGRIAQEQVPVLDQWLKKPISPEVATVRKHVPTFDARVAALVKHARPGDLIFWQDTQGSQLAKLLGEFPHVSLVLNDGKLLDTMSLEGVSIATPESVVGKVTRRMKAGAMAIGRPKTPFTAAQLEKLTAAAHALQGRDYALFSAMHNPKASLSCSRSCYEAIKASGLDLVPAAERQVRNAVMPGDLMRAVESVGMIGEDGVFRAAARPNPWKPGWVLRTVGAIGDRLLSWVPSLWTLVDKFETAALRKLRMA